MRSSVLVLAIAAAVVAPSHASAASCSKANAERVLGGDAGQVVCGPFFGRGSRGMAASRAAAACGDDSIEWDVFRLRAGKWRRVLQRRNGAFLARSGSGIQERVGDGTGADRCFPPRWKVRTWRWTGSRFKASAFKVVQAHTRLDGFLSPDRRVWCVIGDTAFCASVKPDQTAELAAGGQLTVCTGTRSVFCAQNFDAGAPVLRFGEKSELHGFRCTSDFAGIDCTLSGSGKGFGFSTHGIKRFDP
jgi:hypothetical protein